MASDFAELDRLMLSLDSDVDAMRRCGAQLAENERDYRVALRSEILRERADGTPVTIIGDICRGKKPIADKRLARDSAEALYKAQIEAINVKKLKLRLIEAQIEREWGQAGRM